MESSAAPPQPRTQRLRAECLCWYRLHVHHRLHSVPNTAAQTRGGASFGSTGDLPMPGGLARQ
eukprot:8893726-Pyramimonas_sp.AAC.1